MSTEESTTAVAWVPPALFVLSHPTSDVAHAATEDKATLCHVETWGEFERFDELPTGKRQCSNCSLIMEKRGTWRNSPFAQAWLERRRATGTE